MDRTEESGPARTTRPGRVTEDERERGRTGLREPAHPDHSASGEGLGYFVGTASSWSQLDTAGSGYDRPVRFAVGTSDSDGEPGVAADHSVPEPGGVESLSVRGVNRRAGFRIAEIDGKPVETRKVHNL